MLNSGEPIDIVVGLQTAVIFFPDTCEIGAFSVQAGLGETIADFEPLDEADLVAGDYAGGVMFGVGAGVEAASYDGGSGEAETASAKSFAGVFHTLMIPMGGMTAAIYFGDINREDPNGRWKGGSYTFGPGFTSTFVDWKYELPLGAVKVPRCLCLLMCLRLPPIPVAPVMP